MWNKKELSRIEKGVDKIQDQMLELTACQREHTVVLNEHHKRSLTLENEMTSVKNEVHEVKSHVTFVRKLARLVPWLIGIVGACVAIASRMGWV